LKNKSPHKPSGDVAAGGRDPLLNVPTHWGDSTLFWARVDLQRRRTVVTAGFVDLLDPHRMPPGGPRVDPRLGPYVADVSAGAAMPPRVRPRYAVLVSPPPADRPAGTAVRIEYRAAGIVDPAPWVARVDAATTRWTSRGQEAPDAVNFPLDPRKAGDAHVRKFSDALVDGTAWQHWVGFYNRLVTDYTDDPARLHDPEWLRRYGPIHRRMQPTDVRYLNWRLVMENNVDVVPAAVPSIESFALVYRLETQ
jgi:hypothetical protein